MRMLRWIAPLAVFGLMAALTGSAPAQEYYGAQDQYVTVSSANFNSLIDRIEATVDYPTRAGPLCSWCEYRQICPAITGDTRAERGPTGPEPPPVGDQEPPLAARADPIPPPRAPVQLSLL